DIAPDWAAQLGDEGQLVVPLCHVSVLGPRITSGVILTVRKEDDQLSGQFHGPVVFVALQGALAPASHEEALADALQRWFALEDFLRVDLPVRIVMKTGGPRADVPAGVFWSHETPNTAMWIEPD